LSQQGNGGVRGLNQLVTISGLILVKVENKRREATFLRRRDRQDAWLGVNAMMRDAAGSRLSVLVVEDETLISEMIADSLLEGGFAVHAVASGEEALRYLSSGSAVDVLFTDINLAGDMDGSMLAKRARVLRPDLPIVFASGRWNVLEQLRTVPRSIVLPKPYSPLHALSVVQRLMSTLH
jgi:CheY-like chemotaxis protein